jgi:hypothetical protein
MELLVITCELHELADRLELWVPNDESSDEEDPSEALQETMRRVASDVVHELAASLVDGNAFDAAKSSLDDNGDLARAR